MVRILRDLPADSEGSLGSQKSRNDESSIKDFSDFTDSDSESQVSWYDVMMRSLLRKGKQ